MIHDVAGRWNIEWASPFGTEHTDRSLALDGDTLAGVAPVTGHRTVG